MFNHDRFGPNEDYYNTYLKFGGTVLSPHDVRQGIDALVSRLSQYYADPTYYDSFPSVRSVLKQLPVSQHWPATERECVENCNRPSRAGHDSRSPCADIELTYLAHSGSAW